MSNSIRDIDKANVFMPEEMRVLDKTLEIREKIVDKMIEDGIPYKTSEIRVLNEVLNAMDSNVMGRTDRRLKMKENDNNENILEMMREVLINVEKKKSTVTVEQRQIELTEGLRPDEIVLGEDQIEFQEISLEDLEGE